LKKTKKYIEYKRLNENANIKEDEMDGALNGLKILDFTTLLPGPYATMCLADLGADVLRVSTSTRTDLLDTLPPLLPGKERSAVSAYLGRNKRSILLNLRAPRAAEVVKRLVVEYDIVVEQFRPGVMERLGIGYETLAAANPKLIYCAITGYGWGNSLSDRAGHDINYLSLAGVAGYSGHKGDTPPLCGIQIADLAGGSHTAIISILAAALYRERSGKGQFIDLSMTDGAMALNSIWGAASLYDGESPKPENTLLNGGTLYDYYETADGRYVGFGGLEPKFWEAFCRTVGREDWIPLGIDAGEEVKAEVRHILRGKTLDEWLSLFAGADACFEPVLTLAEALGSRYAEERGMAVDVPDGNGRTLRQMGSPYKLSETPPQFRHAGMPASMRETREVLHSLGYPDNEIDELSASGVLQ
jgi:crotonobetainyl-CoA:carnitine CoA-transferase CaiB-like acyl-CoA transferase